MKKIVIPGEVLTAERKRLGEHVFAKEGKIFSDVLGIYHDDGPVAAVVPLRGRYVPVPNDLIIGVVAQEVHAGYMVDINSFYHSFVSKKELRDLFRVGSMVSAKVLSVNEVLDAEIGFVRQFYGGQIIKVSPVKVPRMIGKNGSMLDVLKNGSGCQLMIGRNGLVWAKGGDVSLLQRALRLIEENAHKEHLTNSIADFLKQHKTSLVDSAKVKSAELNETKSEKPKTGFFETEQPGLENNEPLSNRDESNPDEFSGDSNELKL